MAWARTPLRAWDQAQPPQQQQTASLVQFVLLSGRKSSSFTRKNLGLETE